ncbi:hypothetical protein D9M72_525520 [compost metagenome]
MTPIQVNFLVACFAVGIAGALLGFWAFSQRLGRQLDAQRRALDAEREQTRQVIRAELELLGQQQLAHQDVQRLALALWQAEQDARRRAEWHALRPTPPTLLAKREGPLAWPLAPSQPVQPVQPVQPRSSSPVPAFTPDPESEISPTSLALPAVAPWEADVAPERELTDEEIDALPPDLPIPTRVAGRKLPAPKGPVLRKL